MDPTQEGRATRTPDSKPATDSCVTMTEIVNPEDTNPQGNIFGGRVMALIDKAAAVVGLRHARHPIVTASVDSRVFHSAIRLGSIVVIQARLNAVFHSSMEVEVRVESEEILTGERRRTTTAYVTVVAVDEKGHPMPAPPLRLETEEDRQRFEEASRRRAYRLQARSSGGF